MLRLEPDQAQPIEHSHLDINPSRHAGGKENRI